MVRGMTVPGSGVRMHTVSFESGGFRPSGE